MRTFAWISLFVLVLVAACGPPEVSDLGSGNTESTDGTSGGGGDGGQDGGDDDDGGGTVPTGTTPPGPAPILTNVPSFATWNASIRPLASDAQCGSGGCHGGSGGVSFSTSDTANAKYYWFLALCDRSSNGDGAGMQSYSPPVGRFRQYLSGNEPATHPVAIPNNAATVDAWFAQGAGATPPNCLDYYDLANSS